MPRKPQPRARDGEGSVRERPDGKWIAVISRGARGSQHKVVRVRDTEAAALEALRRLRAEVAAPFRDDAPAPFLDAYLERWLEAAKRRVKLKTWTTYELTIRLHIIPFLGSMRIDRIKPAHVAEFMAELERGGRERKPRSPRVRELAFMRLQQALEEAVGTTIVANPVLDRARPRVARKTMKVWTADEARRFLAAADAGELVPKTPKKRGWIEDAPAIFRLALSVGLRRGEICALQWRDVDLKNGRLHVQHTLTDEREAEEAKTSGSRRTIELPQTVVAALAALRTKHLAGPHPRSIWVFPDPAGEAPNPQKIERAFHRAAKAAELPRIRFHDLRHTCATMMLSHGVDVTTVSKILGHATPAITLTVYSHYMVGMGVAAARRVDDLLSSPTSPSEAG